ncbi:MAG: hypothetical protein ABII09_05060 [Planctomycetota bacterium]
MKTHKKWLWICVWGMSGFVLLTIVAWFATSPSVSAEQAEIEWQNGNWVPVTIQSGDDLKLDFALRDRLYEGRLRWPWHIKVSFETTEGKMTVGAVPKGCLLSNVKGKFNLVPKKKKGAEEF